MGWYSILVAVCIVGLGLVVYSRQELKQSAATTTTTTTTTQPNAVAPTVTDHWQVALSVDICGTILNLPKTKDQTAGIITSGNGVVDIEPSRAGADATKFEGANANLGTFLTAEDVGLTPTSLRLPSSVGKLAGTYANGRKCAGKPGTLQLLIWPTPSSKSAFPSVTSPSVPYNQGQLWMLAFVPKGASVPKPPAAKLVAAFVKSTTTTTTTPKSTTTTTKSGSTTTTTTKSGSTTSSTTTTTTSAGSTTTTKPGSSTSTTG